VNERPFVDHYEVLQVSQNADAETIERVFRLLAKRYNPDNPASGDSEKFREVHTACEILLDPERRAEFDVQYDTNKTMQWRIFNQDASLGGREEDRQVFHGVLSLLYVARRRNPESGGLGPVDLERMLGVPREHLEFPLWYLKKRGWLETLYNGQVAITVEGIDKVASEDLSLPDNRLLAESATSKGQRPAPDESVDRVGIRFQ
jgi:curved DNA-binding protein CbpA